MPQYVDDQGRVYFVSDGISQGRTWGVYTRRASGSLRRISSVPLARTRQEAEYNLNYWARGRGLRVAREEAGCDAKC